VSDDPEVRSILVADCGSALTKVVLIEQVEGHFRYLAQGKAPTLLTPATDGLLGAVRQAVVELEKVTGRRFLDESGQLIVPENADGSGVDAFAMSASAAPPLRVVIAGLSRDLSVASAQQGVGATYAVIQDIIAIEQAEGGNGRPSLERQWELLRHNPPDALVVVGGTDGGARGPVLDLAEQVLSAVGGASQPPSVIFAGNSEARLWVAEMVASDVDLRIVDNVCPDLGVQQVDGLHEEVEEVYWERKMVPLPGFDTLRRWSETPIVPSVKALAASVRFIARRYGLQLAAVDAGEGATSVVLASPDRCVTAVSSHWRRGMAVTGQTAGDEGVSDTPEAEDRALALTETDAGPGEQGQSTAATEWWMQQMAAREPLRTAWQRALARWPQDECRQRPDLSPHFDLLLVSGGRLTHATHPAEAVLTLLDVLQPCGVTSLAFDPAWLLLALGAIAALHPLATVQVLARDGLVRLGAIVAPIGQTRPGHQALRVVMHRDDGAILETRVPFGSVELLPLEPEHKARLELWPSSRFDVGLGMRGAAAATEVEGGLLGVIIDARGRPLVQPQDPAIWQAQMRGWLAALGAPTDEDALSSQDTLELQAA
jgi:hypothetical protein